MIFKTEQGLEIQLSLPLEMSLCDLKVLLESEIGDGRSISSFKCDKLIISNFASTIQSSNWNDGSIVTIQYSPMSKKIFGTKGQTAGFFGKLGQQRIIDDNYAMAYQYAPEMLISVEMLFISGSVNNVFFTALVDSGAQTTLMSHKLAKLGKIDHLIDTRFQGMASGVGTAPILGRIHLVDVNLGKSFLPCSFTIMDSLPYDALIGLDLLRRFQCSINLFKNVLKIKTTNDKIKFLDYNEVPESYKHLSHPPASITK